MARKLALDERLVNGLRLASDVHGIGKIAVPADILSKPGRLTESEFEIIKTHRRSATTSSRPSSSSGP